MQATPPTILLYPVILKAFAYSSPLCIRLITTGHHVMNVRQTTDSGTKNRRCPYCGDVHTSQGLHSHVMNSVGDGHGDHRSVPDNFSIEDAPIVDESPSESTPSGLTDDDHYYFCLWCEQLFGGERGYKIHLKHSQGDESHPHNASIDDRRYTLVPADNNGEPFITEEEARHRTGKLLNVNILASGPLDTETAEGMDASEIVDTAIPADLPKPEQVVALLKAEPALYHDPGTVTDLLGITKQTFNEGRNLYDLVRIQQEGRDN